MNSVNLTQLCFCDQSGIQQLQNPHSMHINLQHVILSKNLSHVELSELMHSHRIRATTCLSKFSSAEQHLTETAETVFVTTGTNLL